MPKDRLYGDIDELQPVAVVPPSAVGAPPQKETRRATQAQERARSAGVIENKTKTIGILTSGDLPTTWTTYLNLTATGTDYLFYNAAFWIKADGTAMFGGTVSSTLFDADALLVTGSLQISNAFYGGYQAGLICAPVLTAATVMYAAFFSYDPETDLDTGTTLGEVDTIRMVENIKISAGTTVTQFTHIAIRQNAMNNNGRIVNEVGVMVDGLWEGENIFGFLIGTHFELAGNAVNKYGIYISEVSGGSSNNYAIYTKTGDISFGGNVTLRATHLRVDGGTLYTDVIAEDDGGSGVTIDGVLLKDGGIKISNVDQAIVLDPGASPASTQLRFERVTVFKCAVRMASASDDLEFWANGAHYMTLTTALLVDTINEKTGAAGVTIDGVLVKDNAITLINTASLWGKDTGGTARNMVSINGVNNIEVGSSTGIGNVLLRCTQTVHLENAKQLVWNNAAANSQFGDVVWTNDWLYRGMRTGGSGSLAGQIFRMGANADAFYMTVNNFYPAINAGPTLGTPSQIWGATYTMKHTIDLSSSSGAGGRDAMVLKCSSDQDRMSFLGTRDGASNFSYFQFWNSDTSAVASVSLGQLSVGSPTGGFLGAGKVNVDVGVYLDSTAYSNPDYVFEMEYLGKTVKDYERQAGTYLGRMNFKALKNYVKKNYHLPGIVRDAPVCIFSRADMVLEKLEEAYLYIFELEERVSSLQSQVEALNG